MSTEDKLEFKSTKKESLKQEVNNKNEKTVPSKLIIRKTSGSQQKSPKPRSVLELFKRYNTKKSGQIKVEHEEVNNETNGEVVNVDFDQMTTDEKNGFLKKLKMLSIADKAGEKRRHEPDVNNNKCNQTSPVSGFFKKSVKTNGFECTNTCRRLTFNQKRKPVRKLNFAYENSQNDRKNKKKTKMVEVMAKEYERIVAEKERKSSMSINIEFPKNRPKGSLETPTDSPAKSFGSDDSSTKSVFSSGSSLKCTQAIKPSNTKRITKTNGEVNASWHGELPPRDYNSPTFSRKIFVGGVPWDITETALKESFGEFGNCTVEWPGQEPRYKSNYGPSSNGVVKSVSKYNGQLTTGYVYMIFEEEKAVAALLLDCSQEIGGAGEWYFKIRAQRSKSTEIRQVQIIPWVTSDSLYCQDESLLETGVEPKRTVFVGALHGMITAQVLHSIMEDCFGSVECVQLDTDKFKYPIGSGRVTFSDHAAYFKAIEVGYLVIHTSKFKKRVQIDPFLESTTCMACEVRAAHCFCRNRNCFKYYCNSCWTVDHGEETEASMHIPVIVPSSATKSMCSSSSRRTSSNLSSTRMYPATSSMSAPNQFPMQAPSIPIVVSTSITQPLNNFYGYFQPQTFLAGGSRSDSHIINIEAANYQHPQNRNNHNTNQPLDYSQVFTMMSPQKDFSNGSIDHLPTPPPANGYYCSTVPPSNSFHQQAAYFTSSPSPVAITNAPPVYGGNLYYGYLPPQQAPVIYDGSKYISSAQTHNYI